MKKLIYPMLAAFAVFAPRVYADDGFQSYTVSSEGAWCWFADPRALHYENADGDINASYLGYIDVHGNIKATQMDFVTGVKSEVLVRSYFQPDDHNNPSFLVLPDERILIIYSRHTDEAAFYYRVSTKPGDITTLGEEKCLTTSANTTYPSPFILSDDPEHIYLCWRGIGWHPTIAKLSMPDENGDMEFEWGPYQMVQSTGARPYAKYYSNGKDKLYVTYTTGHPDNESPNWIYFNVINLNATTDEDGAVTTSPTLEDIKGNTLSTIADGTFSVSKTTSYQSSYPYTVVDAPSNSMRDWVWQLACDADGNPVIAMVRINSGKTQHEYYYAKWTGSAWRLTDLADGGGRFHSSNTEYCYSGGEALDPEDPNIIYLSIPTTNDSGESVHEIWKYTLDDNGTVTDKEQLTSNSEKNNVRPFVLPGSSNSPMRLVWMQGDYYYWMVNKSYPDGYPTAIQCDYEWPAESIDIDKGMVITADYDGETMSSDVTEDLTNDDTVDAFTVNVSLSISSSAYYGTILSNESFTYGLEASSVLPYLTAGGQTYYSTNQLYTSDNWALNSSGTNGDYWPTYLSDFTITLSYDGSVLTIYRNGLIDQNIEVEGLTSDIFYIGGYEGTLNHATLFNCALSQAEVKQLIQQQILENIEIPDQAVTDIVLPVKADGEVISWMSDNEEIIASDGSFLAPETETEVHLTATTSSMSRTFTVMAQPRDISQNLLFYYTFETDDVYSSAGSTMVKDMSGNEHDLSLVGSAQVDGTLNLTANSATEFSSNGYAFAPDDALDNLRSYTAMFTATPASLTAAPRFYDFGSSSANSLFLRANTLAAGIKYNGGTTTMTTAGTTLSAGTTYKVAATYDARTGLTTIYIDGVVVGSGTENTNEAYLIAANATAMRNYLGRTQWWDTSYASDNGDYVGTYDDFRFYNTALTQAEICELQDIKEEDESLNTDCTDYLKNYDFEAGYSVLSNSGVTSDRAIYVPDEWTVDYTNGNENDMTLINSDCLYASLFTSIPTTNQGGTNAYLVRQKWGTSTIAIEQKVDSLPAGYYRLGSEMWQSGSGGSATIQAQPEDGTAVTFSAAADLTEWQSGNVMFSCDGVSAVTVSLIASHDTNGSEKYVGFDNLTLTDVTANRSESELASLLVSMEAAADELLAGGTLTDECSKILDEANTAAKALSESSDYDSLYAAYIALRNALMTDANPDLSDGVTTVTVDGEDAETELYDLAGRLLYKGNSADTPAQTKGVYIKNGKKVLVK